MGDATDTRSDPSNGDPAELGPVDYVVIEFPAGRRTGEGLHHVVDLVDRGLIRILDLTFLQRNTDGTITEIALTDLDGDGELDLAVFRGASSGLIAADDVDEAGTVLEPGCSAALFVYENLWAAPLAAALRRSGAQIVAGGRIQHEALIASITATDVAGTT
jgi:hypothetical protein